MVDADGIARTEVHPLPSVEVPGRCWDAIVQVLPRSAAIALHPSGVPVGRD